MDVMKSNSTTEAQIMEEDSQGGLICVGTVEEDSSAKEDCSEAMDVMGSNATTEALTEEDSHGRLVSIGIVDEDSNAKEDCSEGDFRRQLRETIRKESLDFDTWTSLVADIEKYDLDDINTISLVYDSFLSKFPLCHVYWKKYADHTTRLCTVDKAVDIFERAVQSATYCVGLWVDYCTFSMAAFEDPFDIRRLFNRGMSFVGKDYLCHTLWDKYIEFEYSQHQWSLVLNILIQTLKFPTKKLHIYYDNFKKFAAILEEERECLNASSMEVQAEVPPCDAVIVSQSDIHNIIKEMENPSNGSLSSQALQKYLATGEQLYRKACQLDEKIHIFETSIGRSFFHVKPLNDNQLGNWHSYLDFVEKQDDFDWTVKLYEKCLIPCANYPEFWMRYVEFMETKGGRELANFALERATQIFLENAPVIHMFNARFREQIGDVDGARAAFLRGDEDSSSYFVENVIKAANMEKRLGNLAAASSIYENALKLASEGQKLHNVPILYVRYSRLKYLIAGSVDAAINVMLDGIEHVPHCRLLLEELIKNLMTHEGSKYITVVDSIIANAITSGPEISRSLSTEDKEDLSCLYLEFIDLCGTNDDVRKAWNRHIKLFPHLLRKTNLYKNPTATNQLLDMTREARKRMQLNQLSKSHGSDHLIQISVQEQELLPHRDLQPDQVAEKKLPNDDGNGAQEKQQLLLGIQVLSGEETMGNFLHQSGDVVSRAIESTLDMVCHPNEYEVIELTSDIIKSDQAASESKELINEFEQSTEPSEALEALQQSSSSSEKQEMEENEMEKHQKPVHLERVSLSFQEKESQDLRMEFQEHEHDAAQEKSFSDGQILELSPSEEILDTASPKSSPATIKNKYNEDNSVNLSSSSSHQSHPRRQTELQSEVPSSSGKNCLQNPTSTERDVADSYHEHSHDLQQHPGQEESATDKKSAQIPAANVNEDRNQYPSGATQGNASSLAWPVKQVELSSYASAPLSESSPQPQALMSHALTQTSEPHGLIQHNQEYSQMSQYQFQQQQQQQQLLLQQQYQNQMLQIQNQYFQLQQQNQQLYQHQQSPSQQQQNQPQQQIQHQPYLQQAHQLQQPPYQLEQQQYLFYLQQQQQQQQYMHAQQLQSGQQAQGTQLTGQEHQTQLQQHNYQSEEHVGQYNQQGYQLLLQQYQVQQQQVYQQFLQQHELQQQQAYQQFLSQYQLQQQQITSAQDQSNSNYVQGQGVVPQYSTDAAGFSGTHSHRSPEGMSKSQNSVRRRPNVSPQPDNHVQESRSLEE